MLEEILQELSINKENVYDFLYAALNSYILSELVRKYLAYKDETDKDKIMFIYKLVAVTTGGFTGYFVCDDLIWFKALIVGMSAGYFGDLLAAYFEKKLKQKSKENES